MKKVFLSASALLLASAFSFAGTPETKANAKPEVRTETTKVYHYVSQNGNGSINFAEGEPAPNACGGDTPTPCRWTSEESLTSPMQPVDIENQAEVTDYRKAN